jgi:N-acylglucosamine-6-phosphate 2-epimerase
MNWEDIKGLWQGGLIVSCQAAADSPLARPDIIAALSRVAEANGAVGVRIDGPGNIRTTRGMVQIPILGLEKIARSNSEVYITPTYECAARVAFSGADVIALDATERPRSDGHTFADLVRQIRKSGLKKPVMADVASLEQAVHAVETVGVEVVSTTLSGYTAETAGQSGPDFALVEAAARRLSTPVICEGRLYSPDDVRRAFDCGAFAVVVGTAITGIDWLVRKFGDATPRKQLAVSR